MMHNLLIIVLLIFNFMGSQKVLSEKMPDRIILSLTSAPQNSMAVTWRTNRKISTPQAQIAKSKSWLDFERDANIYLAKEESVRLDSMAQVYHYSVIFKGLDPNTLYVYRVGGDSVWSEWNHFNTAKDETESLKFTYFGDAQHDVKKHVSRLFRKSYFMEPDVSFWLSTGDLLDKAECDKEWEEFFAAVGFIPRVMPFVLTTGNHEYENMYKDSLKTGEKLTELWLYHITQPKSSIDGLNETVFFIEYQYLNLIVLNGNDKLEEQARWLVNVLEKNQKKWTIISLHQPVYSMGKGRDKRRTQDAFLSIIDRFNVDLVLQGHDHVYSRTYKIKNGKKANENEKGTVYVISNCGSDSYSIDSPNTDFAAKLGNKVQLFQVLTINSTSLFFKSYTVSGELYDQFELKK